MAKYIYGVWTNDFTDNGCCDWYEDADEAFDAWHKAAEELEDGEYITKAKFDAEDGEIVDGSSDEIRREGEDLHEYDSRGNRLWA